jgi:hypothetical protein
VLIFRQIIHHRDCSPEPARRGPGEGPGKCKVIGNSIQNVADQNEMAKMNWFTEQLLHRTKQWDV